MNNNHNSANGFSLVELLIALAIGAIIIGAAFGSYMIVARNYEFQKDMKYISQSAHAVVKLIRNDIRMAGYKDDTSPTISNALTLTDSGANCCDSVDIVYDKSATDRHWIRYWTEAYPANQTDRYRLYKRIHKCTDAACTTFAATDVLPKNPIADYVEDLQFTELKNGLDATIGPTAYGEGNSRWLTPEDIISVVSKKAITTMGVSYWIRGDICEDELPHNQSNTGQPIFAVDGDPDTAWSYIPDTYDCRLLVKFKNPMRVIKVNAIGPGGMEGGSEGNDGVALTDQSPPDFSQISYPYGYNYPASCQFSFLPIPDGCIDASGNCNVNTQYHNYLTPSQNPVHYWDQRGWVGSHSRRFFGDEWPYELNDDQKKALFKEAYITTDGCNSLEYRNGISSPPTGNTTFMSPWNASHNNRNQYGVLADIRIFAEVYGEPQVPNGIAISVLLRSPNEHGTVNRANNWNSKVDKYLRDSYTTSTVVRNLFYQSQ